MPTGSVRNQSRFKSHGAHRARGNFMVMLTLRLRRIRVKVKQSDRDRVLKRLRKEFGDSLSIRAGRGCIDIEGERIRDFRVRDRVYELAGA